MPEIVRRLESRIKNHELSQFENQQAIRHNSSFKILVIGDGPERAEIESRIRNYELSDKVRFLGQVTNNQLPNYYLLADVLIMPSEEEGFPHVLLEAMAAGVSFVAFDVGGVREILPPELLFYVVPPGNVDAFVAKIEETLRLSGDRYAKISEIEKKWVERYDIKKVGEIFRKIVA